MLHLSKTQCSTMNSLRSHKFREAVSDLLTVTMQLQDALSRFHRAGLHEVDLRVHVWSASTCTLSLHESQRCWAARAQDNGTRRTIAHLAPLVSRCDTLASSTNQCRQLGFTRVQANHVLLLGRVHWMPRVFNGTLDPNSDFSVVTMILGVSSPASVITKTEPCGVPAIPGTSKQPAIMLHAGFPTKYLSKRLMLRSSFLMSRRSDQSNLPSDCL